MRRFALIQSYSDNSYCVINRYTNQRTFTRNNINDVLRDIKNMTWAYGSFSHSSAFRYLLKSDNLDEILTLPKTHPEYFI